MLISLWIRQVSSEESSCLMVIFVSTSGQLVSWHHSSATEIIIASLNENRSMTIFLIS